jgi:hypothetical protein
MKTFFIVHSLLYLAAVSAWGQGQRNKFAEKLFRNQWQVAFKTLHPLPPASLQYVGKALTCHKVS